MSAFAQLRSLDGEAFRPDRDIVNLSPRLAAVAAEACLRGWPGREFAEMAARDGVTLADLAQAATAFTRVTALCTHGGYATWEDAYAASGLAACKPLARTAVFCQLGATLARIFHHCARQSNPSGYIPFAGVAAMEAADQLEWAAGTDLPSKRAARVADVPPVLGRDGTVL